MLVHTGQPLAAHTDMYVHVYAHMACALWCVFTPCVRTSKDCTNKDSRGAWVMVAAFYNCPKVLGLFQKPFCVLYEAVYDVAFTKPERHALSSQSQPLAAVSSSIPAGGEEDATKENFERSSQCGPSAIDGSVLV